MVSWEDIQNAFIEERITFNQLFEVLVDNFGIKKASKIIEKNLKLSLENKKPKT